MKISVLQGVKPIEVSYVSREFASGDTMPIVYSDCKLSILLSNGLSAVTSGQVLPTEIGDILTFNPSEIHYGRLLRSGLHSFLDIYIPMDYFDAFQNGYDSVMRLFFDPSPNRKNIINPAARRSDVLKLARRIAELWKNPSREAEFEIYLHAMELVLLSLRLYDRQKETPVTTYLSRVVINTVHYLENHFTEPVSLTELAKNSGCSVTYLTRTFKLGTGKTVHSYLTEYRLHEAQRLLSLDASVTEACFNSGFTDCSAFIRTFRKYLGTTPAKYKKDIKDTHQMPDGRYQMADIRYQMSDIRQQTAAI